jgi:uncharacterized membrane protein HdeD (DUF308 family)
MLVHRGRDRIGEPKSRSLASSWSSVFARPWRHSLAGPVAARGILAMAFGVFALSGSWGSPAGLARAFALYAIAGAAAALVAGLRVFSRSLLFVALVNALTGGLVLLPGALGELELPHLVGAWAMLTGVLDMFAAGAFRRTEGTEWFQGGAGGVSILLGMAAGTLSGAKNAIVLGGWLGAMSLLFGVLCVAAAARESVRPVTVQRRKRRSA